MKKLVVVFLCFFASNAFASSADSGKCPWKIPFTISIHAIGSTLHQWHDEPTHYFPNQLYDTSWITENDTEDLLLTIDSTIPGTLWGKVSDSGVNYSLKDDTLQLALYYSNNWGSGAGSYQLTTSCGFVPGENSIYFLSGSQQNGLEYLDSEFGGWYPTQSSNSTLTFNFAEGLFDDTSIFTADSSFKNHKIHITYESSSYSYTEPASTEFYTLTESDFTASSVTLSGIFRTTTFSDPPSIVTEAPHPNTLAIYSSNGSIACSFEVSDHARDLEIFSPLGIREASYTIQAGQTEASLPHLPVGFYFVRLEGSMAKIYISGY